MMSSSKNGSERTFKPFKFPLVFNTKNDLTEGEFRELKNDLKSGHMTFAYELNPTMMISFK